VDAWIAPRAEDIASRLPAVEALLRIRPDAATEFRTGGEGVRWPLLFFAVWSLIHLEGASPKDALAAVVGA
jgi:asparagine synthase (glutamine-hydrolysing)